MIDSLNSQKIDLQIKNHISRRIKNLPIEQIQIERIHLKPQLSVFINYSIYSQFRRSTHFITSDIIHTERVDNATIKIDSSTYNTTFIRYLDKIKYRERLYWEKLERELRSCGIKTELGSFKTLSISRQDKSTLKKNIQFKYTKTKTYLNKRRKLKSTTIKPPLKDITLSSIINLYDTRIYCYFRTGKNSDLYKIEFSGSPSLSILKTNNLRMACCDCYKITSIISKCESCSLDFCNSCIHTIVYLRNKKFLCKRKCLPQHIKFVNKMSLKERLILEGVEKKKNQTKVIGIFTSFFNSVIITVYLFNAYLTSINLQNSLILFITLIAFTIFGVLLCNAYANHVYKQDSLLVNSKMMNETSSNLEILENKINFTFDKICKQMNNLDVKGALKNYISLIDDLLLLKDQNLFNENYKNTFRFLNFLNKSKEYWKLNSNDNFYQYYKKSSRKVKFSLLEDSLKLFVNIDVYTQKTLNKDLWLLTFLGQFQDQIMFIIVEEIQFLKSLSPNIQSLNSNYINFENLENINIILTNFINENTNIINFYLRKQLIEIKKQLKVIEEYLILENQLRLQQVSLVAIESLTKNNKISDVITKLTEMIKKQENLLEIAKRNNFSDFIEKSLTIMQEIKIRFDDCSQQLFNAINTNSMQLKNDDEKDLVSNKEKKESKTVKRNLNTEKNDEYKFIEEEIIKELNSIINDEIPLVESISHGDLGYTLRDGKISGLRIISQKLYCLPDNFTKLIELEELFLHDTKIIELPQNFGKLKKLKILRLSLNSLESLPESISELTNLEELDIWGNNLSSLPLNLGNLRKLKILLCYDNKLNDIPESFLNLTNLKVLNFKNNKLSKESIRLIEDLNQISNSLKVDITAKERRFKGVKTINSNKIVDHAEERAIETQNGNETENKEKLTTFYSYPDTKLHYNDFTILNELIELLKVEIPRATEITVGSVGFVEKNGFITELGLHKVNLGDNLTKISQLSHLEILEISRNNISELPDSFENLKNLKTIFLDRNNFETFPQVLLKLISLETILLSKNQLMMIPKNINNLFNLVKLYINYNKILVIPKEIGNLNKLKRLRIKNNKLRKLPNSIMKLSLSLLDITNNNLASDCKDILIELQSKGVKIKSDFILQSISKEISNVSLQSKVISENKDIESIIVEKAKINRDSTPKPITNNIKENFYSINEINENYYKNYVKQFDEIDEIIENYDSLNSVKDKISFFKEVCDKYQCSESKSKINQKSGVLIEKNKIIRLNLIRSEDSSSGTYIKLPEKISVLSDLKTLYIDDERINCLPNTLSDLPNLEAIFLKNTRIKRLPEDIGKLINLKIFVLKNNGLKSLPYSIGNFINLERLDLNGNKLSTLPSSIIHLKNLKILDLGNNPLDELSEVQIQWIIDLHKAGCRLRIDKTIYNRKSKRKKQTKKKFNEIPFGERKIY